jgi:multiple sugar transport system substrate-binding protein
MKQKVLWFLLGVFLFATAALNATTSAQAPLELKFIYQHGGPGPEFIKRLCREFGEQSGGKYHVNPIYVEGSYEGILEKLQALAAVKQLPELTQAGHQYFTFIRENLPIVPVQKFINAEKFDLSDFFPKMLDLAKDKKGVVYAIPFAVSTPVMFYNKNLFKTAGLNPQNPPKTYDEVRKAAKTLTKGDQYGVYYYYGMTGNWIFQSMVENYGGRMLTKNNKKVAFKTPGLKVLRYLNTLVNGDKSMPLIDEKQADQAFVAGKLGMYLTTTAHLTRYNKSNLPFEVGTIIHPSDGVSPRSAPAGGNSLYILKSTPEKEKAAWEFIKFATSPAGTTQTAQTFGYMVTRKSAMKRDDLMGKYLKATPPANTTYQQAPYMSPWCNFPGRSGTRIYKIVQDEIAATLNQQKTPEQAINDMVRKANAIIRK